MKEIKSTVTKSPHYGVIMEKYEQVGTNMSYKDFYNQYVVTYDPSINLRTWSRFMQKINERINEAVQLKANQLVEKVANQQVNSMQMEDDSLRKILAIADLTLDQVIQNPDLLKGVPIEERMKWLFNAMKARSTRIVAMTKAQAEKRKTSMYEDMLEGAQYGAIDASEAENSLKARVIPKRSPQPASATNLAPSDHSQAPISKQTEKVVEFSPKQFENAS